MYMYVPLDRSLGECYIPWPPQCMHKRKRDALLPPTMNFSGWEPITTSAVNHHAYPPLTTPDRGNWQPGFRFRSVGPSAPVLHRYAMPATKREPRTVCSGGLIRYVCAVFLFFFLLDGRDFYHCTASQPHPFLLLLTGCSFVAVFGS